MIAFAAFGYRGRHECRAAFLGVATGCLFGLNSSLIAGVGAAVSHGAGLFTTWQTYVVAIGIGSESLFGPRRGRFLSGVRSGR